MNLLSELRALIGADAAIDAMAARPDATTLAEYMPEITAHISSQNETAATLQADLTAANASVAALTADVSVLNAKLEAAEKNPVLVQLPPGEGSATAEKKKVSLEGLSGENLWKAEWESDHEGCRTAALKDDLTEAEFMASRKYAAGARGSFATADA